MSNIINNLKGLSSTFRALCSTSSYNLRSYSHFTKLFEPDPENRTRQFHTSLPRSVVKPRDRKDLLRSAIRPDDGTDGEKSVSLNAVIKTRDDMFTDLNTPNLLFNGVRFSELPVCNIKSTKNNTHINLADYKGKTIMTHSCGIEGFKNTRKGTNVAGQATALTLSKKAVKIGIKDVRVKVQGLGPGRMAAIKGLEMGGFNIVSVTDDTRITFRLTLKPRKRRRL